MEVIVSKMLGSNHSFGEGVGGITFWKKIFLKIGQIDIVLEYLKNNLSQENKIIDTVEHTHDACPKYIANRIIAYLYVSDGSRRRQRQFSKKKVQRFYI